MTVQTVLFNTHLSQLRRLIRSVGAAATVARHSSGSDSVREIRLLAGDCTPEPVLGGGTDADVRQLAATVGLDGFEYVPFRANLGHGAGQNRLAEDSHADALVFVNPDAYLAPGCLAALLQRLVVSTVALAEARQCPMENPKFWDLRTSQTPWATACCLAVRRSTFEAAGGFDPAFFLHGDDVDLSWRIGCLGLQICYVPSAIVFHDRGVDPSGYATSNPTEAHYIRLGSLLLAWKAGDINYLDRLLSDGTDEFRRSAAGEFCRLRESGRLPTPYSRSMLVTEGGLDARRF